MMNSASILAAMLASLLLAPGSAQAHLLVNNAIDVVISKDRISLEARISLTQVYVVEAGSGPEPTHAQWAQLVGSHRAYLLRHLHLMADGAELAASPLPGGSAAGALTETTNSSEMAFYHIEYPLASPPSAVRIAQDCLKEYEPSDAAFVLRSRQEDEAIWETAELHRGEHGEFDCHWNPGVATIMQPTGSRVGFWSTASAFLRQGIWHILTGYDHLLFVSALVLAATSVWDLVKVVAAFTLAHSVTLTLSVLNVVNLSSRIVEPMISASILLVAMQNIFWPRQSTGWARIGIAFGFGLFHGLGFAGGLKDAMSELPAMALWTSLISFSLGVEIGHQIVVLPLYATLREFRKIRSDREAPRLAFAWQKWGSCAIGVASTYFLYHALRPGA